MKKKILMLVIVVTILFSLTGCWDLRDIDTRATILAVSIDYADNPQPPYYEESNLIKVTLQLAISQKVSGGAGQSPPMGNETVWNISGVGANVAEAIDHIQDRLKYTIFLGHTRVIVISQQIAHEGINRHLNYFRNNPEFRRLGYIIISRGRAEEILNTFPKSAVIQAMFLMEMIETAANNGAMPDIPFIEYIVRLIDSGVDPVTILMDSKMGELSNVGMAVFKGDKMVGILDRYETTNFIQLTESEPGGFETVRDVKTEQGTVSVVFSGVESCMKPELTEDDNFRFIIDLRYEASTFYQQHQTDYWNPVFLDALEQRINREIKNEIEMLVHKTQQKFEADIFGFGDMVRAYMPSKWKEVDDWRETYIKAEVDINVNTRIRRFGMSTFKQR